MAPSGSDDDVTAILARAGRGEAAAADRLMPLVYDQLQALAQEYMSAERPDHTLQATALVNEAYLRLVDQTRVQWHDRNHFFAVAATMIRRILVDHARAKNAARRGGDRRRLPLEGHDDLSDPRGPDLLALDEALTQLRELNERQAQIVELRFFGGLTIPETADLLDVSTTTIENDWAVARAWLRRALAEGTPT